MLLYIRIRAHAHARMKRKEAKNVPNVPNVPKSLQIAWKIRGDVAGDIPAKRLNVPPRPIG